MKVLKRTAAIVLVFAMIVGLSGCNEVKKAEETLNSTMTALQTGDFIGAASYIKNDTYYLTKNALLSTYKDNGDLTKDIFSKLSYKINSAEKIDNSLVKMNVDITNVNMKNILSSAVGDLFSLAISSAFDPEKQMSDEEMQNKMAELISEGINAEGAETVTSTVDVNAVKTEDGWKIDADDKVIDAVTGGLLSTAESMGNAFGE